MVCTEHWAVKSKFGLDAKGSDYIFKQHVTRLEDIYVHHKTLPPESHNSLLNMSPVSQLYGVNGTGGSNMLSLLIYIFFCDL
jgi:hypothetical protein